MCCAVMKCILFLVGLQHFSVITDHNPLIPIISNCHLDEIENPCLQRLTPSYIMTYNFTAEWIKSKNDTLDMILYNSVLDVKMLTHLLSLALTITQKYHLLKL